MCVKLGVILFLLKVSVAQEENHNWDLAVAINDQVELLNSNGSLVGTTDPFFFSNLKALTFDNMRHQFIVSDMEQYNDTIYTIPLQKEAENTSNVPIIADLPDDVQGLAIDPVKDILYWTDSINKTINYVSLNDPLKETHIFMIFKDEEPQDLAIDSCRRYIYWTNSNIEKPTIDRATLDGKKHEVLVDSNLFRPGGIAIDHISQRLYWADMGQGIYYKIESTNLVGKERQIIFKGTHQKPVGVAVDKDAIYWTDVNNNALWRIRKKYEEPPFRLRNFNEKPMGIVAKNIGFTGSPDCNNVLSGMLSEYTESTTEYIPPATDNEIIQKCLNYGEESENGCLCRRGYTGTYCEISLCYNYCLHGNCFLSQLGYPSCRCAMGFTGSRCDRDVCEAFCLNDGDCNYNKSDLLGASCSCSDGFSGKRCEINLNATNLCYNYCRTGQINVLADQRNTSCRCDDKLNPLGEDWKNFRETSHGEYIEHNLLEYFKNPASLIFSLCLLILLVANIGLIALVCRLRKRRSPRINKRIIVNKNITPLTYRPQPESDQCEITIENCCNMNVCETPCFEPPQLRKMQKKDEKKTLLTNMENGDDLY